MSKKYRPILARQLTDKKLRWDVPARHQGQHIEVAYSEHPFGQGEADEGARYRRITNWGTGEVYFAELGHAIISKRTVTAIFGLTERTWAHHHGERRFGVWQYNINNQHRFLGANYDEAAKLAQETDLSREASTAMAHGVQNA